MELQVFLRGVQEVVDAKPTYRLGGYGRDETCDCIGLIIGAVRRGGGTWSGTHGSNWAARNAMQNMVSAPAIELGTILYKAREPGHARYGLPTVYASHRDKRDYYHVGVVTSANPLRITHCTSGGGVSGIKIDTALGDWKYGGRLKGIEYDSEVKAMETARVDASTGRTVRMRVSPAYNATISANIPIGTQVDVLDKQGEWWQIRHAGKTGWMVSKFLDGSVVPVNDNALLTELEGLAMRSLAIIKALREGA